MGSDIAAPVRVAISLSLSRSFYFRCFGRFP
jgi:hypothetical protein